MASWEILDTWWFIPLSKWIISLVINGISGVSPLITRVITHLLSGMNHQVWMKVLQMGKSSLNAFGFSRKPRLIAGSLFFRRTHIC